LIKSIEEHDNISRVQGEKEDDITWFANTNKFTGDLVRAIRCAYKDSAVETASQIRGM
jgi:hypothetical protein